VAGGVVAASVVGYLIFRKIKISRKKQENKDNKNETLFSENSNEVTNTLID